MMDRVEQSFRKKMNSRKWWAFVGVSIANTALLATGLVDGQIWSTSEIFFYGTYVTGNVMEKSSWGS